MPLHSLINFEIQKYYQNEPKFDSVYSRNNLSKIENGVYLIDLDKYESIGTHWIDLYVNAKNVTYVDTFGVKHFPRKIKKFVGNKNIITNVYRIQAYDSTTCRYFCIGLIDFISRSKSLLNYAILFFRNDNEKNGKMILNYL